MLARVWSRHWPALMAALLALCALLPVALPQRDANTRPAQHTEWPQQWEGRELRPLAMSAMEQRFAARFPGAIARFTDGERVLVLRSVNQPTRMLHPAADCFRGLGYRVENTQLEHDTKQRLWRCFEAQRSGKEQGQALRVCERIEGQDGRSFIDPSSWFWAASLNPSPGPWLAITIVEAL